MSQRTTKQNVLFENLSEKPVIVKFDQESDQGEDTPLSDKTTTELTDSELDNLISNLQAEVEEYASEGMWGRHTETLVRLTMLTIERDVNRAG